MARTRPNPYLSDSKPECHGRSSERRVAKSLGAELNPASGALEGLKGDSFKRLGEGHGLLIESKATTAKSISIKKDWLDKIRDEAIGESSYPALTVSFVDEYGRPQDHNSDWVMIPKWLANDLFEGARKLYELSKEV
jgi:hypothetical protein